ncbi:MAG: YfhO family protein [Terriglobia bacterium]|jgi:hypothetical protein
MSLNTSLHAQPKVDSASDSYVKVGPPLDRVDLALAAILALGSLLLFWKVIFTPSMLFFRDIFNYTYPCARFIQQMCRRGQLPYWNPYLNCGQPLLANPNLLFFYPYTLLNILLPIDLAYPLFYVVHFALAGIGTFLLARRWGQSRQAAFFAGFVFAFSGPLLSLGNLYNHAACAAWMPWALLATDRAVQGRTTRPWILLTLVFSLQLLAAEPFTLITTFILCLAYALYLAGTRRPLMSRSNLQILAGFTLVGCLMVALCALQFLPSVELLSNSHRGAQGLLSRETSNWSLHPLLLMEMLVPDFYGPALISPTSWNALADDGSSPYFISVFMGFVPLFFALAGWAFGRDRRRNFVAGAAILILLLSFGHFTPLFSLAYLLVPLLCLVRFPVKLLVPFIMLVAILAGWGLDALRGEVACWQARRNRALLPLGFLLGCCLLIWTAACVVPSLALRPTEWALLRQGRSANEASQMAQFLESMLRLYLPGAAGFLLAGFLLLTGLIQNKHWARSGVPIFAILGVIQLVPAGFRANPSVPPSFYDYVPPVVSRFEGSPGTYRVASLTRFSIAPRSDLQAYVNFQSIPEAAAIPPIALGVFRQKLVLATGSMAQHVEGSLNLDFDDRSLPPFLFDVWIYILTQAPDALRVDCLLGRTNVKYIIRPTREVTSGAKLVSEIFNGSPEPSYLYENPYFVPRAYVAGTSIFTTSPLETLSWMASPDFDALENVILAADPGASPAVQGSGPAGQVEITERHPNRVTLKADLSRPGYVVLLDRYDSNWHASIDGREVPVLRANQLFRAVYAEPGQHVIAFYYRQQGLLAGMFITCITIVALLWLYARNPGLNGQVNPAETSC